LIAVDTNVIARYVVRDDPAQMARVDRLLESRTADDPAFISRIALVELVWVLRKGYRYDRETIADVIERILSTHELHVEDHAAAVAALAAYRISSADYADCLMGLLNRDLGCAITMSFDTDAAALPEFQPL
jgi:predicted nucleic-acid-binding protein